MDRAERRRAKALARKTPAQLKASYFPPLSGIYKVGIQQSSTRGVPNSAYWAERDR